MLESAGSVRETKWHDKPLKRPIVSVESGFPLMSFSDPYEVVGMPKIDLGVNMSRARSIEKIRDEWEWIAILVCDAVQTPIVNTESQRTVLFLYKKDRSTTRSI